MEGIGIEIQERIKKKGLIISRVPEWAKEAFIARAKAEFSDDYGMCLAAMFKESNEYAVLKQKFFDNDLNIQMIIGNNIKPDMISEDKDVIRAGNGKIIRKGRKD